MMPMTFERRVLLAVATRQPYPSPFDVGAVAPEPLVAPAPVFEVVAAPDEGKALKISLISGALGALVVGIAWFVHDSNPRHKH